MAQSVKQLTLDLSSGLDLRVMGSSSMLGSTMGMRPTLKNFFEFQKIYKYIFDLLNLLCPMGSKRLSIKQNIYIYYLYIYYIYIIYIYYIYIMLCVRWTEDITYLGSFHLLIFIWILGKHLYVPPFPFLLKTSESVFLLKVF